MAPTRRMQASSFQTGPHSALNSTDKGHDDFLAGPPKHDIPETKDRAQEDKENDEAMGAMYIKYAMKAISKNNSSLAERLLKCFRDLPHHGSVDRTTHEELAIPPREGGWVIKVKQSEHIQFALPPYPPAPVGLCTLPEEILESIINYVEGFVPSERKELVMAKWQEVDTDDEVHWDYESFEDPFLNSLQSLGTVNQKLYRLCRPWLWKVSVISSWPDDSHAQNSC